VFYERTDGGASERRIEKMNASVDELGSPVGGDVAFATNEERALLGLRFREGRRSASLEKDLEREGFAIMREEDRMAAAREQLVEYFAGEHLRSDLQDLPGRGALEYETCAATGPDD
jgi:hypothetical protein